MAGPVADRVWRDVAPDEIEPALADVRREAGSGAPLAHAVMSNLVVVRMCGADEPLDAFAAADAETIDAVAARHPSRVIVIAHEAGCALTRAPLAARVGLAIYGPPQARYVVEQVSVRSSCEASSLPSIVRRLIRGDLPTTVWCPGDLSQQPPIPAIVAEGRQLLYDSRRWRDVGAGVRAVVEAIETSAIDVADLNWRGLTAVRQALRHAGDELSLDDLRRARVRISHAPADAAIAWLLRGWLAARLGWRDDHQLALAPDAPRDARLVLTIGEAPRETTVALSDDAVRVAQHGWPPYTLVVPHESIAEAVAAELRTLASDAALRETLRTLARYF